MKRWLIIHGIVLAAACSWDVATVAAAEVQARAAERQVLMLVELDAQAKQEAEQVRPAYVQTARKELNCSGSGASVGFTTRYGNVTATFYTRTQGSSTINKTVYQTFCNSYCGFSHRMTATTEYLYHTVTAESPVYTSGGCF